MRLLNGDRSLSTRVFSSPPETASGRGILFVHGLGSSQAGYADRAKRAAIELGATCVTFDLGGHGLSTGQRDYLTPTDHLSDLVAAYDLLAKQPEISSGRLGICGASYGAYLAPFMAERRHVSHMLLRAPALYDDKYLNVPWSSSRRSTMNASTVRLEEAVTSFHGRLLILESENDSVLPTGVTDWYTETSDGEKVVLQGAGHALETREQNDEFVRQIVAFFGEM